MPPNKKRKDIVDEQQPTKRPKVSNISCTEDLVHDNKASITKNSTSRCSKIETVGKKKSAHNNNDIRHNENINSNSNAKKENENGKKKTKTMISGDDRSITYLEEQVRIKEITVQAWKDHRDEILTQKENAISDKRQALSERDAILNRQQYLEETSTKHVALETNLTRLAIKSRDKLRRLTLLLQEEQEQQRQQQEQEHFDNPYNDSNDTDTDNDNDNSNNYNTLGNIVQEEILDTKSSRECLKDYDDNNTNDDDNPKNILAEETMMERTKENTGTGIKKKKNHLLVYNPYRDNNSKDLVRYHSSSLSSSSRKNEEGITYPSLPRYHRSLLAFLPYLDAIQVGDYLTLMLRESKTLDEGNTNIDTSLRRKLIENTSLDISLLVKSSISSSTTSSNNKSIPTSSDDKSKEDVIDLTMSSSNDDTEYKNENCHHDGESPIYYDEEGTIASSRVEVGISKDVGSVAAVDTTDSNGGGCGGSSSSSSDSKQPKLCSINPNISLCPYEFNGGICADDLCPYQHTKTKNRTIIARERLPLPSLSSILSPPKKIIQEAQNKYFKKPKSGNAQTKVIQKTITAVAATTATGGSIKKVSAPNFDSEQVVDTDGNNKNENDISKSTNEDNFCFGEEEDLIMLPSSDQLDDDDGDDDEHKNYTEENIMDGQLQIEEFKSGDDSSYDESPAETVLPLTASLSAVNKSADVKRQFSKKNAFWWGGNLACIRGDTCIRKDEMGAPCEKVELSIIDILQETFGIIIRNAASSSLGKMQTAAPAFCLSSSHDTWLEIKDVPSSQKNIKFLETLGRLVDASRVALHGGLDCIAITFCQINSGNDDAFRGLLFDEENDDADLVLSYLRLLKIQVETSWLCDGNVSTLSCFETAFATQLGISILSWSLGAHRKVLDATNIRVSIFESTCRECFDTLRYPVATSADTMQTFDDEDLSHILSQDTPMANTTNDVSRDEYRGSDISSKLVDQLGILQNVMLWAREKFTIPSHNDLRVSDQRLDEKLKNIWLVAKSFLLEYRSSCSSEQSEWELQCLKVVIIMGYAIIGCLTSFAKAAGKADRQWKITSRHSSSNVAAWNLLDVSIVRILKDLHNQVTEVPLLDLVLVPLHSCIVASASFLRNYSVAQNRLEDYLRLTHRKPSYPHMLTYSELMWSQLIQLRMSLPNESTSSSSIGDKNPSRRADDISPWEPSPSVREENRLLIAKLECLKIKLRHVVLWGDWILSSLQANDPDNANTSRKLLLSQTNTLGKSKKSTSVHMKKDLRKLKTLCTRRGRTYPPESPLPQLPLFLLYAGHSLTDLNLDRCCLDHLPRSFGFYFPNLKTMNLSHNKLKELPNSFQNMFDRMKFLEEFSANHNIIRSLPTNMFSNFSGIGASTVNSSSGLSPSQQQTQQESPLRILNLSYNNLTSIPSMAATTTLRNLEVLKLNNNLLVDLTMIDLSRMVLKLPSLRELTHESQRG